MIKIGPRVRLGKTLNNRVYLNLSAMSHYNSSSWFQASGMIFFLFSCIYVHAHTHIHTYFDNSVPNIFCPWLIVILSVKYRKKYYNYCTIIAEKLSTFDFSGLAFAAFSNQWLQGSSSKDSCQLLCEWV